MKQKNPQNLSTLGTHQKPLTIKPYPMKILFQIYKTFFDFQS